MKETMSSFKYREHRCPLVVTLKPDNKKGKQVDVSKQLSFKLVILLQLKLSAQQD